MRTYRPRSEYYGESLVVPSMTVHEQESGWRKTGLVDQYGVDLMACDEKQPVGFLHDFTRPVETKPQRPKRKKR